ncbi:MAG: hypothetical protein JRI23_23700 [Deltaproteobacteria bacterium]|jgi:Zn ribbon nucleic-acid-binding protein|nr:hypothetical protein [Deltaproteobacteria bacterium]MBW2534998.1 hypothetical protein [Deltaproteobacteria bacterium]
MTKKTAVAGEVDAYCTKCKLDLSHRVIAMVEDRVHKVECLTCGGHHLYRAPRTEEGQARPRATAKRTTSTKGKKAAAAAAARAATERQQRWEQAIMGRPADAFTAYSMGAVLAEGELVRHGKFGDGVVTEVRTDRKVTILFEGGERTLVHAQG